MGPMPGILRIGYGLLVTVFCLTWSSAFVVGKIAVTVAPPALFLAFRFLGAGALLLAFAAWRGSLRQPGRIPWAKLLVLGVLNQACYNGLSWSGMQTVSAGLTTVIASTNPLLIGILAVPMLGERLTVRRVAGLLLGVAGVVFLVRNRLQFSGEDLGGVLRVTGGLGSLVAGSLLFKAWSPRVPLTVVAGVQSAASGVTLLAVGLITERMDAIVTGPTFWLALVYNIFVVAMGANVLWFLLLQRGSAVSASSLHFLMPPLGLSLGWAALGEPVNLADLAAAVPIVLGIWLVTRPVPSAGDPRRAWNPLSGSGSIDFLWIVLRTLRLGIRLPHSRNV